jgi:hypothetical protein
MAVDGFLDNLRQGDILGLGQNLWEGARDEWLGLDDFGRVVRYGLQGDFGKALKSLGAGAVELGGTALMFVPGGQIAGLAAKGGKLGKVGKTLKFFKPLTREEQAAARFAKSAGARPGLFSAPKLRGAENVSGGPIREIMQRFFPAPRLRGAEDIIGRTIQLSDEVAAAPAAGGFRGALSRGFSPVRNMVRPEFVGWGPGGYVGSVLRAPLMLTGATPMAKGPLAGPAFKRRAANVERVRQGLPELPIPLPARAMESVSGRLGVPIQRPSRDEYGFMPGVGKPSMEMDPRDAAILELLRLSGAQSYSPLAAY